MNVVIDTNVLISGIFFSGVPFVILKAWYTGKFDLLLSKQIFDEYRNTARILAEEFPPVNVERILEMIKRDAVFCKAVKLREQICTDPDDDKFLACALAGEAECIVSGDKHLLKVSGYRGIKVLRPRAFLENYLKGE